MGPICKCSSSSRKLGIRHGVYVGEKPIPPCKKWTNNGDRLYHYKVTLAPPTNFLVRNFVFFEKFKPAVTLSI